MDFYKDSLQKLTATLKAREAYYKTAKDDSDKLNQYDLMIALATKNFLTAYKQIKSAEGVTDETD